MVFSYQKSFDGVSGQLEFKVPKSTGLLKIELDSGSLNISGRLTNQSAYTSLAAVNCSDYSKVTSITSGGIYNVEIAGLHQVKLEYNGSGTVITALIE